MTSAMSSSSMSMLVRLIHQAYTRYVRQRSPQIFGPLSSIVLAVPSVTVPLDGGMLALDIMLPGKSEMGEDEIALLRLLELDTDGEDEPEATGLLLSLLVAK